MRHTIAWLFQGAGLLLVRRRLMLNSKLTHDCHEVIAQHLPDEALRSMAQVSRGCRALFDHDKFYSPAANELRQPHRAYVRAQTFHKFVRQLPAPFNKPTKTRQQDPHTWTLLQDRFTFRHAPAHIQSVVMSYPHEIPVLDLGSRVSETGYIDFVRPEAMAAPVMRGEDSLGRLFLSVKATSHFSDGTNELGVNTIFEHYVGDSQTWCRGNGRSSAFFDPQAASLLDGEDSKPWTDYLGELLKTGDVHAPDTWGDNGGPIHVTMEQPAL